MLTVTLRLTVGSALPGHLSSWHYFLTQLRVIVRYVQLVFVPIGLNLDYDFRPSESPLEPTVIASFVFLSGILVLGWSLRRRAPVCAFSILWFFITLAPTSSVVPIVDVIFEHRLYLPLVGVCLSFPLLVDFILRKVRGRLSLPGTPLRYSCLILVVLGIVTGLRNHVWGDEVRLWTDVVSKSPEKERPYNALGWAHYKLGDYSSAIDVLRNGLDKIPKAISFPEALGNFYLKAGKFDEAVKLYQKTVENSSGPMLALAYNNLGVAYLYIWNDLQVRRAQMGEQQFATEMERVLKPAAEAFRKGLEVDSDMPWAVDSYINVSYYRGQGDEVEAAALEKLREKEDFSNLYIVGKSAFLKGDYAKADEYFERSEKLKSNDKLVFFNHGYALGALGQDNRAIEKYLEAIRIEPIFIEAHHNVGLIYMRRNEYATAAEHFAEVLRQDPKHVSSNLNLGRIYIAQGNKALARIHLETVLAASPGNSQAATLLQQAGL
jgi:tetratricopeptide (TPR) repeat protein